MLQGTGRHGNAKKVDKLRGLCVSNNDSNGYTGFAFGRIDGFSQSPAANCVDSNVRSVVVFGAGIFLHRSQLQCAQMTPERPITSSRWYVVVSMWMQPTTNLEAHRRTELVPNQRSEALQGIRASLGLHVNGLPNVWSCQVSPTILTTFAAKTNSYVQT